jgi:hypothetical protein
MTILAFLFPAVFDTLDFGFWNFGMMSEKNWVNAGVFKDASHPKK